MMQRWRLYFIALAMGLLALPVQAQAPGVRVAIVSSQTGAPYMEAAQALVRQLESQGVPRSAIQLLNPADVASVPAATQATLKVWVALGTEASAALARARLNAPVLSALIPRRGFERVLRDSGRTASAQFNALYLDQPLPRQLALIRLALPQARQVGMLLGPQSWPEKPALIAAAGASGLSLRAVRLDDDALLFDALQSILADSEVLLAQADPLVYNSNTIQNILLTSVRLKVPLLAFSPAYVRAGALLALYSTPTQAGTEAAHWVLHALAMRGLPEQALEPADFEISVNAQVARVLGLTLDAQALRQALKRLEQRP